MITFRAAVVFCIAVVTCAAQAPDMKFLDRYAAVASETVDVNLEGPMLQMAAKFLSADDPEQVHVRKLISGLRGVYVKSFTFDKDGAYSKSDLLTLKTQLHGPGWSRIVGVQEKSGENTEVWLQSGSEQQARGLFVVVAAPRELTVVRILGSIDLDQLSELGNLGVPKLNLDGKKTEKKEAK